MNATSAFFSPARFVRLARLQLQAQARSLATFWLIMLVVMALVCAVRLTMGSAMDVTTNEQMLWYYAGLFFSGYLLAHQVFGMWRRRETALLYLMQPASSVEKWLVSALMILALWPLLYTLTTTAFFMPVGWLSYQSELSRYHELLAAATQGQLYPEPKAEDYAAFIPFIQHPPKVSMLFARMDLALWLGYAMFTGYAAFALTWARHHATLGTLALGIVLALITLWMLDGDTADALMWWAIHPPLPAPPGWAVCALNLVFWLGVPALMWAAAWRALCEKDLS